MDLAARRFGLRSRFPCGRFHIDGRGRRGSDLGGRVRADLGRGFRRRFRQNGRFRATFRRSRSGSIVLSAWPGRLFIRNRLLGRDFRSCFRNHRFNRRILPVFITIHRCTKSLHHDDLERTVTRATSRVLTRARPGKIRTIDRRPDGFRAADRLRVFPAGLLERSSR